MAVNKIHLSIICPASIHFAQRFPIVTFDCRRVNPLNPPLHRTKPYFTPCTIAMYIYIPKYYPIISHYPIIFQCFPGGCSMFLSVTMVGGGTSRVAPAACGGGETLPAPCKEADSKRLENPPFIIR